LLRIVAFVVVAQRLGITTLLGIFEIRVTNLFPISASCTFVSRLVGPSRAALNSHNNNQHAALNLLISLFLLSVIETHTKNRRGAMLLLTHPVKGKLLASDPSTTTNKISSTTVSVIAKFPLVKICYCSQCAPIALSSCIINRYTHKLCRFSQPSSSLS